LIHTALRQLIAREAARRARRLDARVPAGQAPTAAAQEPVILAAWY